jgi:hypothetical protein
MRGLDTRIAFAMAKVLSIIDPNPEAKSEFFLEVFLEAQGDGYHDYNAGIKNPPIMFMDEIDLVHWWKLGQSSAAESEEMNCCSECNDRERFGDPCSTHG